MTGLVFYAEIQTLFWLGVRYHQRTKYSTSVLWFSCVSQVLYIYIYADLFYLRADEVDYVTLLAAPHVTLLVFLQLNSSQRRLSRL